MLINESDAATRLNSPLNLMNRLRRESVSSNKAKQSMSLFTGDRTESITKDNNFGRSQLHDFNPFPAPPQLTQSEVITPDAILESVATAAPTPGQIDSLIDGLDIKLKQELIHRAAMQALESAVNSLNVRLPEIKHPEKLADVAGKMSKIVSDIRNDRKETGGKNKTVHLHFYTPEQKKVADYNSIDV